MKNVAWHVQYPHRYVYNFFINEFAALPFNQVRDFLSIHRFQFNELKLVLKHELYTKCKI